MEKTRMSTPTEVVMHPLVLLSVVDHFTRLSGASLPNRRVVGILLGTSSKGTVDVTNSFAVPFDEDPRSPNVLYFDHNYVENMYAMFRKVNARERIVGWYSSGPKIRSNDLDVHQILRGYAEHPVYCIVEVQPKDDGMPCTSYIVKEETEDEASQPKLVFQHIFSRIGALEAEEIGVEHLLRDVSDTTVGTLSTQIRGKVTALQGLSERITEIVNYLQAVVDRKLPINHNIMYKLQDMLNLLPHLQHQHGQKEVAIQSNDDFMTMYVASVVRSVLALHNLVINKRQLRQNKIDLEKKKKEEAEKKEKEEREKKEKEEKELQEKEEKERKEKEDQEKEGTTATTEESKKE